eukprot:1144128-Pelagomonas_calceolata.AAC.3
MQWWACRPWNGQGTQGADHNVCSCKPANTPTNNKVKKEGAHAKLQTNVNIGKAKVEQKVEDTQVCMQTGCARRARGTTREPHAGTLCTSFN